MADIEIPDKLAQKRRRMSCKVIKVKLQALCKGQFCLEEMTISKESEHIGLIKSVIPKDLNHDYKGEGIFINSCEIGATPTLLYKLGIYNLELPCTVKDKIDWFEEDYDGIAGISLYPVTTSDEYEPVEWKDNAVSLNREAFYPLYIKYHKLLGIREYVGDAESDSAGFKIELHDNEMKRICKDENDTSLRLSAQAGIWKEKFSDRTLSFMLEYTSTTVRNGQRS